MYLKNYTINDNNILITMFDDIIDKIDVYDDNNIFISNMVYKEDSTYEFIINELNKYQKIKFKSYIKEKEISNSILYITNNVNNSKKISFDFNAVKTVTKPINYISSPRYIKVNYINRISSNVESEPVNNPDINGDITINYFDNYDRGFQEGLLIGSLILI